MSTDQDLVARWAVEPAPLLPLLHAFHNRDGYLSEAALRAVSEGLRIPLADLYGTVTFYHHFAREEGGHSRPRVCDGPICKLRGSDELMAELDGATPMPCAGRCDDPIPVLVENRYLAGRPGAKLRETPAPMPDDNPGELEECCFAGIREDGRATLMGYCSDGGYGALTRAVREGSPAGVIEVVEASGLAGRGGAGFPTGRKWRAVAEAPGGPKTIVCNADEGEPGCFKDRVLMDYDPHAVIEGMALAAFATGATRGFIYLRYEYPHTERILEDAILDARDAGLLGQRILGSDFSFELYVRRGAGAYICGEETSLLNSLEGKHPFPRNKPPYPVTHGFEDLPTVVNNVETLASVPPILAKGADWYRGLGLGDHAGTKIISLSGDVQRPGNYEVPIGLPLDTLLNDWAGGPLEGRTFQAVTMAGLSGGFLGKFDDVTLDEPCLRARGSFLGAGGIMVFDDRRDMVDLARQAMAFFAHESCGKCFPCRIGTQRLTERLAGEAGPADADEWKREVADIGTTMAAVSACGLGIAAPLITQSLLRDFPDAVDANLEARKS
ncbi:NADH-ubiquinone oxidoreductase-F iron-sulfur binding region domain-containing protein [Engelhardtia mirabilis]|uniref:NADH-quinone oxidoreductase subunit 1 n=1 Tax=Engelhardtia mirabilis TaxID=2528011 RepID=A0A518BDX7_9BACT|nr:NADH-quinone oxidoreductase subunit 1 [Planctomycetes bacterium Pla133]QDU99507.1 NADH-quinone oxidoreductase subunit 1 [Planctomycetes bacterium Pla86]